MSNKTNKKHRKLYPFIFCVLSIIATIILLFKYNELSNKKIEVLLKGSDSQVLSVNSSYIDDGFEVLINGEKVNKDDIKYKITDNINEKLLGEYEVNYEIEYRDKIYNLKRNVKVVDVTEPEFILKKDKIEVSYCNKDKDIDIEYSVIDDYDGDLTDKVDVIKKDEYILLSVMDSSDNTAVKKIPIIVNSKPKPRIELKGSDTQYLKINTKYQEDGAILTDGCGKTLDEEVTITNTIDTTKVGTYKVKYSYKQENTLVTKERTVVVYEELDEIIKKEEGNKVVYLTFDDGPGQYTDKLLDILKKYDVKATFFVTNQFKKYVPLIEREAKEGHVVAVHTLTHKWSIYKSVDSYMRDFNSMNEIIYKYTGNYSKIFRFPGGSSNTISKGYSKGVVSAIANKLLSEGYVYFDWNVDSNDAAGANKKQIYNNVINGMKRKSNAVVLMHDIKKNTIAVIEDIIVYGLKNGYRFEVLTPNSPTIRHSIRN